MVTNETFEEQFGDAIPAWLLSKARECGWTHPTYAQQAALQSVFRDSCRNVLLQAQTGSGKTLAYLVPCLSRIDPTRSSLQAVVVVPTRELGLQVAKVARRLASGYDDGTAAAETNDDDPRTKKKKGKILVMNVLQGSKNRRQRAWAWAEPPHVVIGTPPELLDMVAKGGFKRYNSVRTLIVDEVDACLLNNMGSVVVSSASSSSSASYASSPGSGSIQLSGTTLHELLSKHLSPTYVDSTNQEANGGTGADLANLGGASSKQRRPVERRRLTLFCSATIPQPRHFVKQCVQNQWMLQEPVHVRCQPNPNQDPYHEQQFSSSSPSFAPMLPSSLVHQYVVCADQDQKMVTLRRLLQRIHSRSASTSGSQGGDNNHNNNTNKKKVLVFCDPRRPMKDMATIIGRDLDRAAAAASVERRQKEEEDAPDDSPIGSTRDAVVSVLSLEDSLTERADAMAAFRGDDAGDLGRFGNEQDGDDEDVDGDGLDERAVSPGFSSPWSSPHVFSNARTRILLSSDLAARGLDIVDITHVIHFDLPINADAVRRTLRDWFETILGPCLPWT
jgi:superfamily II DNA/RNA helicase